MDKRQNGSLQTRLTTGFALLALHLDDHALSVPKPADTGPGVAAWRRAWVSVGWFYVKDVLGSQRTTALRMACAAAV